MRQTRAAEREVKFQLVVLVQLLVRRQLHMGNNALLPLHDLHA